MNHLFERASSYWVCYDRYELKEGNEGIVYVTPAESAIPKVYDPLKAPEEMVLAALNVGMLCMGRKSEEVIRDAVMEFVSTYGLLLSENDRNAYRMGMAAFGGIAPTYHIALLDKAAIVWDFNSMLQAIQLMFSFLLTDGDRPLKLCKFCQKAFIADEKDAEFCSPKCRSQYDAYKKKKK